MKYLKNINDKDHTLHVLNAAHNAWNSACDLRQRRLRYKLYTYGRQWDDIVKDAEGNSMTEGQLATLAGKKPYTNNLIRRLVKSIVGHFRNNIKENPIDENLEPFYRQNLIDELDSRLLEEFLISGCAIQRITYERRRNGDGIWAENVNPARFFVNAFQDPRAWDIELVGMLHDMSMTEVIMRFAHGSKMRARELQRLYKDIDAHFISQHDASILGAGNRDSADFFRAPAGRCRVIEVWTLESREVAKRNDRKNSAEPKWEIRTFWQCRYIAPDGTLLDIGETPYRHGSHPFVVKFYPLTDGEVHSFVEDVIDQQRYINRLITLIDHIMSVSAKGVLLFPARQKPTGMSWDEIARAWATCDRIIPYEPQPGDSLMPQQIVSSQSNHDAHQLLSLEMKMLNDVAGINDAFLGKNAQGNTSAAMYESQIHNATLSLIDILDSFATFRSERDLKAGSSR